jgi:hypothetical protein
MNKIYVTISKRIKSTPLTNYKLKIQSSVSRKYGGI